MTVTEATTKRRSTTEDPNDNIIVMPLHWRQPIQPFTSWNASMISGGDGGGGGGGTDVMTLPSFPQLQLKTHQTLYGGGGERLLSRPLLHQDHHSSTLPSTPSTTADKSPKGFVDGPIQHLVDLINSHSHYCTLSSCSGRLSVFDPHHHHDDHYHHHGNGSGHGLAAGGSEHDSDENNESDNSDEDEKDDEDEGDDDVRRGDRNDHEPTTRRGPRRRNRHKNHHNDNTGSGKGSTGRWILVSHHMVDPQHVMDCLNGGSSHHDGAPSNPSGCRANMLLLKFEPFLLHVAAASLHHGRYLLKLALELGFRESGLVVTETRVTVAIRSHSLALAVPLFFGVTETSHGNNNNSNNTSNSSSSSSSSNLSLSTEYLTALVLECNRRLQANWMQLDRLYDSIASHLFQLRCGDGDCITVRAKSRPHKERLSKSSPSSLNLWNATAVAAVVVSQGNGSNQDGDKNDVVEQEMMDANIEKQSEIWVVGGYGKGPDVRSNENNPLSRPNALQRSKAIYRLTRESDWEAVKVDDDYSHNGRNESLRTDNGMLPVSWLSSSEHPDLQGMASCQLSCTHRLVILWGGRRGPTKPSPSETLYVLDPPRRRLGKVTIQSSSERELPGPRWGHSLLALDKGDRAVLLGGCNEEDGAMDDIWILHLVTDCDGLDGNCHFVWEKLDVALPTPRFHFGSALLENDIIMILGGLTSTKEILNPFEEQTYEAKCAPWALRVEETPQQTKQQQRTLGFATTYSKVGVQTKNGMFHNSWFGMACCTLKSKHLLMVTGGISTAGDNCNNLPPIQAYWVTNKERTKSVQLERIPLQLDPSQKKAFNFGSLVHHSCLPVGDDEMIFVGGGVSSFAFGEVYAKSHHLWIDFGGGNGNGIDKASLSEATLHAIGDEPTSATIAASPPKPKAYVIYTNPSDAKKVKNILEANGWLDKRFRMIKMTEKDTSTTSPRIAVPITISADQLLLLIDDSSLKKEWIVGHGLEELPWSSSQIASQKNKNRRL